MQIDEISQFIQTLYSKKIVLGSPKPHSEHVHVEKKKPVRIYIDGGFDLLHSGHYNAIRQAKALGDILVVGVNSDAEILKNKGPTVLNGKERADILRACKWVDEVHEDTEYTVREETLDRYNCQYYAHGDDPVYDVDGTDMCALLQSKGRFKMFKRTEGVSTTDIVGKLLMLTRDNSSQGRKRAGSFEKPMLSSEYVKEVRRIEQEERENSFNSALSPTDQKHQVNIPNSSFLATTRRLMHFSNNREPKPTDRVVYIQGSFDLLHNGHIDTLKKAKELGDFLYVGVWADDIVSYFKGSNYPILSLHERVLMVLACRYVDDVVIGSNYQVTKDMIKSLNIKKVVHPRTTEDQILEEHQHIDQYQVAKEMGVYEEFDLDCKMTVETIGERVVQNREKYKAKFDKKKVQQDNYYETVKQYVAEI